MPIKFKSSSDLRDVLQGRQTARLKLTPVIKNSPMEPISLATSLPFPSSTLYFISKRRRGRFHIARNFPERALSVPFIVVAGIQEVAQKFEFSKER